MAMVTELTHVSRTPLLAFSEICRRESHPLEPGLVALMSTLSMGSASLGHRRGHHRLEKRSLRSDSLRLDGTERTLGGGGSSSPECI